MLPHPELARLAEALVGVDPIDLDDTTAAELDDYVAELVRTQLLPLFVPRGPKYPRT